MRADYSDRSPVCNIAVPEDVRSIAAFQTKGWGRLAAALARGRASRLEQERFGLNRLASCRDVPAEAIALNPEVKQTLPCEAIAL